MFKSLVARLSRRSRRPHQALVDEIVRQISEPGVLARIGGKDVVFDLLIEDVYHVGGRRTSDRDEYELTFIQRFSKRSDGSRIVVIDISELDREMKDRIGHAMMIFESNLRSRNIV